MKLKGVESICKASGEASIIHCRWGQWIGDYGAMYRADDIPIVNEETLCAMWSVKRDKMSVRMYEHMPYGIDVGELNGGDMVVNLMQIELGNMVFFYNNDLLIPVDKRYLKPFGTDASYVARRISYGGTYRLILYVMEGVSVMGVVFPMSPLGADVRRLLTRIIREDEMYELREVMIKDRVVEETDEDEEADDDDGA